MFIDNSKTNTAKEPEFASKNSITLKSASISMFRVTMSLLVILILQSTVNAQSLNTGVTSTWVMETLYFNVVATNDVNIENFEFECQDYFDPGEDVFCIYKRASYGSFQYYEYTPSAWELISTSTVTCNATQNVLTGTLDVQIDAGETQAFMIHIAPSFMGHAELPSQVDVFVSNDDIGISSGTGFSAPFGVEYSQFLAPKLTVNYCLSGCMDSAACNYDSAASCDDGSCTYPQWYIPTVLNSGPAILACDEPSGYYLADQTCAANTVASDSYCVNNLWDGICMSNYNCCLGNFGCGLVGACNYDPSLCPDFSLCIMAGCTNSAACNYDSNSACDDGSCILPQWYIPSVLGAGPMVQACAAPPGYFLANQGCAQQIVTDDPFCLDNHWDLTCQIAYNCCIDAGSSGCLIEEACNYDPTVCSHVNICTYPGCTTPGACNYDSTAGCDDGSCTFPGCTDEEACNYDSAAGCDDGSCSFAMWYLPIAFYQGPLVFTCTPPVNYYLADQACAATIATNDPFCLNNNWDLACQSAYNCCANPEVGGCTFFGACNYNIHACIDDGTCLNSGCMDPSACNYDPSASCDNGACVYPNACGDCFSILPSGCTDSNACNYSGSSQCDDGSCVYPGCTDPTACNYDSLASCSGGVCTYPGCTYPFACNYDPNAACDDGSCETVSCAGCTNPEAPEYDPTATIDDGSCTIATNNCPGDFNGDLLVNTTDLLAFLGLFSTSCN